MTSDPERSREFYGALFSWEATDPAEEFGGYFQFLKDGRPVGGCMAKMDPNLPDIWSVYLNTDDAQKAAETAQANGGMLLAGPDAVGDLGTMVFLGDPGGAGIGAWQPNTFHGIGVLGEANTPGWFELHTRSYGDALSFYRNVFGWNTRSEGDTDEFRYSVMVQGEEMYAGVMDATAYQPEGTPGVWTVYFQVDDVDATLARATELGATVIQQAEDTPYGRLAVAGDPTGAQFKLVGPNANLGS
jgi:predicted enzyme related to lactoylglutathione lyase